MRSAAYAAKNPGQKAPHHRGNNVADFARMLYREAPTQSQKKHRVQLVLFTFWSHSFVAVTPPLGYFLLSICGGAVPLHHAKHEQTLARCSGRPTKRTLALDAVDVTPRNLISCLEISCTYILHTREYIIHTPPSPTWCSPTHRFV